MKEIVNILKNDGSFLKSLQMKLWEKFGYGPVTRSDYRLFMSQQFRIDKIGSHEILQALVDAGFAKNKNRGICLDDYRKHVEVSTCPK